MEEEIKFLMEKYKKGELTPEEEKKLETLIGQGKLALEDFEDLQGLSDRLDDDLLLEPPATLDHKFYQSLHTISKPKAGVLKITRWMAGVAASILVLVGFGVSMLINQSNAKVHQLTGEMKAMREMMMLSMLEHNSPSDRLKAVSLTADMPEVSDQIAEALLYRVNHDRSDNVRIASIEALRPYAQNARVREGLINAIQHQHSPLVLMSLAETLKSIGEKPTLEGFQGQMNKQIPQEILKELETGLKEIL